MNVTPTILHDLALVLGMAAITSVVFRWLRQPPVMGYLLAGLAVGPYVPFPVFADPVRVQALSELGVVLVMFAIGLEFSIRRLVAVLPNAGFIGLVQIGTMLWLGGLAGRLFGWTPFESLFLGALLCVSSTMIVSKAFAELGITGPLQELVLGVLLVQDLAAVLLLAVLTTMAARAGQPAGDFAAAAGPMAAGLAALVIGGLVVVPRVMRQVGRLASAETLLVAGIGLCFGLALAAEAAGFSVALGAFLAGMFIAESGEAPRLTPLVTPLRDLFAAVFFVSVGMLVNPAEIAGDVPLILAAVALVLAGMTGSVALGAFLSGQPVRIAVRAGMSLAQIGEFSFIMAAAGTAAGVAGGRLTTVAVAASVLTTFATPWMIRASERVARSVKTGLPRPLQAFALLYAVWLEHLPGPAGESAWGAIWRPARLLLVDAGVLAALVMLAPEGWGSFIPWVAQHSDVAPPLARGLLAVLLVGLAAPLGAGLFRNTRNLGLALGQRVLPSGRRGAPPGDLPRRVLVTALQCVVALPVGAALLAVTRPVVSPALAAPVLALASVFLGVVFWKGALHFQAHMRTGTRVLAETLLPPARPGAGPAGGPAPADRRTAVTAMIPVGSRWDQHTLAELDLESRCGVTVAGLVRVGEHLLMPAGGERVREGDILKVVGRKRAVLAARAIVEEKA